MPDQPPGDRAVILACTVRSLRRWCLDTVCECGRSVVMVASGLGGRTMADVVVQLRCWQWGQRPADALGRIRGPAVLAPLRARGASLSSCRVWLGAAVRPTKSGGMEPTEKPMPQSLAERIAKLWESPTVSRATKVADAYTAKSLAKLNEFLARLNAKN